MDEQTNLITRVSAAALDGLAPRTPFITLEMAPRESHLLDYLMILRKHQWLIVSFLFGTRHDRDDCHLSHPAHL